MGIKIETLESQTSEGMIPLDEAPESFEGKVQAVFQQKDEDGKLCTFMDIEIDRGVVRQKFRPFHLQKLVDAMKKLGIDDTDQMEGRKFYFEQVTYKIGNPRWVPKRRV